MNIDVKIQNKLLVDQRKTIQFQSTSKKQNKANIYNNQVGFILGMQGWFQDSQIIQYHVSSWPETGLKIIGSSQKMQGVGST